MPGHEEQPQRKPPVEQVGEYTIEIVPEEPTPESEERWNRRVDNLVAWLLAEWRREQRPEAGAA